MRSLVVADASLLIGLDRAGHIEILPALFPYLVAPPAVIAEFGMPAVWLRQVPVEDSREADRLWRCSFGAGESEVLAVALAHPGSTILMDEKRGRRIATGRGIRVIGTAGVLLVAKRQGVIPEVRTVLDELVRTGFRLSESLYLGKLERAGEQGMGG
jgi:uncharacterized protein